MHATLNVFYNRVKLGKPYFTLPDGPSVKLDCMGETKGRALERTEMGQRIATFMTALGITNRAQFAEGVLGISRQTFHAWLHKPIRADNVAARPLLLCAQALNTNPEYLLGLSDDPRPEYALSLREAQLIDAYRVMNEIDRDRLLKMAADWVGHATAEASAKAPFRTKFEAVKTKETK